MKRLTLHRSPWLSASVKPVHRGFYEVRGPMIDEDVVLHWNGRYWGHSSPNPFGRGLHYVDHGFGTQKGDEWRGVTRRGRL